MPADVSAFEGINARSAIVDAAPPRRLPLGVGLMVAASASVGLWFGVAAGIKALFF
jgi:hypothetical protein